MAVPSAWAKVNQQRKKHRRYKRYRMRAINALGGMCKACGVSDRRILQIDHKNGDGRDTKKRHERRKELRNLAFGFDQERFLLLCANCHLMKTRLNKEDHVDLIQPLFPTTLDDYQQWIPTGGLNRKK